MFERIGLGLGAIAVIMLYVLPENLKVLDLIFLIAGIVVFAQSWNIQSKDKKLWASKVKSK